MKKLTIIFVLFAFSLLTNSYTHKQEIVQKGSARIFYPSLTMRGEIYSHPNQEERTKDSLCFAEIVEYLAANEDWVFELTRHTDSRGSEEANLKLSQLQAENFKNSLVKKLKVDSKQLIPVGKGENEPLILIALFNALRITKSRNMPIKSTEDLN